MRQSTHHRRGFTLIEVLIAVGIIVLLTALAIPAILAAKKHATETRIKSDLSLIGTALEAYKDDNNGDYPRLADAASDYASLNPTAILGNGTWLDYQNCRGATLLCRALIGPGPQGTSTTNVGGVMSSYANPGDDGADGPGYRVRRTLIAGSTNLAGKVYGYYIDPSKFKIDYADKLQGQALVPGYPAAFPLVMDINGSPILYYPAAVGNSTVNLSFSPPQSATVNAVSRFNGYDNQGFLDAVSGGSSYSPTSSFAQMAASCGTPNYLLWTAGADGQFGLVKGKTDDITNFDIPANLKK